MTYPHDSTYLWPFPRLAVRICAIESSDATNVIPAYVDTGADATLVPIAYLKAIRADEVHTARLRSHWGEVYPVTVYLVDMDVAGYKFPSIDVVAETTGDNILLGRNILDKLILLIDGPEHRSQVLKRGDVKRIQR